MSVGRAPTPQLWITLPEDTYPLARQDHHPGQLVYQRQLGRADHGTHNGIGYLGLRYLYVGQFDVQWDDAFGLSLHYMHARHYSPGMGRFLQPDPPRAELNPFAYGANSPVSRIDSSGETVACTLIGWTFWIPFIGKVVLAVCGASIVIGAGIVAISGLTVWLNHVLFTKASTPARMHEQVRKGQAPKSVTAMHNPHVPGAEPHVHFRDGYARNQDGRGITVARGP